MTPAKEIDERKDSFCARFKQRLLQSELLDLPTLGEIKLSFKNRLQALKNFAQDISNSASHSSKAKFITLYEKLKSTAFYHFMAANSPNLAHKLANTVGKMREDIKDERTDYIALPAFRDDTDYAPLKARRDEVDLPDIEDRPVYPRAEIPQVKRKLGSGIAKEIFELHKQQATTKNLLRQIKVKTKVIPQSKIESLTVSLEAMAKASTNPEEQAHIHKVSEQIKDYPRMNLQEKIQFSKNLTSLLAPLTVFNENDLALIIIRHHQNFTKSLENKKSADGGHAAHEIEMLQELQMLSEQGAGDPSKIAESYKNLSLKQKQDMSLFVSNYLKDKRARAILGVRKTPDVDAFKREEIDPILHINESLKNLDKEIQLASSQNNEEKMTELLKYREWGDNIATADVVDVDGEAKVVGKKFKFGSLQSVRENNPNLITPDEMLKGMTEVAKGLATLHARDFLHRDLALRNILVTDETSFKVNPQTKNLEKSYDLRFALSDFGRSKNLNGFPAMSLEGDSHPLSWMSYEDIKNHESTKKSDVYSFGVTLVEALTGPAGFDHCKRRPVDDSIDWEAKNKKSWVEDKFVKYCQENNLELHPEVQDLISSCLAFDPQARPSIEEVVSKLEKLEGAAFKLMQR